MVAIQDRQKEAQAPKLPPFPSLHIFDSIGGGKGKSTFSRFIAHHIQYNGLNGVLFDADLKSLDGSVKGHISPVYPDTVDLDLRSGLGYGASDANNQIMNSLRSGLNVFVNLPGSSFEFSSAWLRDSAMIKTRLKLVKYPHEDQYIYDSEEAIAGDKTEGQALSFTGTDEPAPPRVDLAPDHPSLEDLIEGRHFAITRWHLCGPTELDGQEFVDAVNYYEQHYPGRINHVLVRNSGLLPNPLRPYWEPLYRVEGLDNLTCRNNVYTVTLPRLAQPEVDLLSRNKLTYAMAFNSPKTTVTSKSRIYEFLKEATLQANQSGLLRNLIKLSDMEPSSAYILSNRSGSSRVADSMIQPGSQVESQDNPQSSVETNSQPEITPAPEQIPASAQEPDQVPSDTGAATGAATEAPPKADVEAPAEDPTVFEDVMEDFTDPSEMVNEPAVQDDDDEVEADALGLGDDEYETVNVGDHAAEVDDSEDSQPQSAYSSGMGFAQSPSSNKRKG